MFALKSFTIVIAGDGPLAKEVNEAVKKQKGKIKFVHAVFRAFVAKLLAQCSK